MSEILTSAVVEVCNGAGSVFTRDLSMFGKEKITFGSSPANDIFIDSPVVSENHGYFQFTNRGWVVFDNHS
jgi:pSer/pThr/pTyr-binding forkhead associated (FHA) protein